MARTRQIALPQGRQVMGQLPLPVTALQALGRPLLYNHLDCLVLSDFQGCRLQTVWQQDPAGQPRSLTLLVREGILKTNSAL